TELETRHPGLSHNEFCRADAKPVTYMNGFVVKRALRGEIFTKSSPVQIGIRKFVLPERIMFRRVNVNRLLDSSVYRQIRSFDPSQVQLPSLHAARHRRFEDRGPNGPSVPLHFAGKANVYRQKFHVEGSTVRSKNSLQSQLAQSRMFVWTAPERP